MSLAPRNPFRIRGYEKFWLALLAGNSVQVPVLLTLALIGRLVEDGTAYTPTPETVIATVSIFWTALWSALGAFFGTSTPTSPSPSTPETPDA